MCSAERLSISVVSALELSIVTFSQELGIEKQSTRPTEAGSQVHVMRSSNGPAMLVVEQEIRLFQVSESGHADLFSERNISYLIGPPNQFYAKSSNRVLSCEAPTTVSWQYR